MDITIFKGAFLLALAVLTLQFDKYPNSGGDDHHIDNSSSGNFKKDSIPPYPWNRFVLGADLSYVNAILDAGTYYKDSGRVLDPYQIFKNNGANLIRLRMWHNPSWHKNLNGGKLYNDLLDIEKSILRCKQVGLAVNLDMHFSDTWADPGRQETPEAWKNADLKTVKDSIYNYTLFVLNHLQSKSLVPEMIQIGNENNGGICWPVGKIKDNDFSAFATLIKSGIQAVRDFSKTSEVKPQIILHVAQLQNAEWWSNGIIKQGGITDFDVLGLSHYYNWSTINSLEGVTSIIRSLKTTYNKKIMVVETAYPWTNRNADGYNNIISGNQGFQSYGVNEEAQLNYLRDLTQAIIDGGGTGIMYWEPAWITSSMKDLWGTGSSWDNCTLFDANGNTIKGIRFYSNKYNFK